MNYGFLLRLLGSLVGLGWRRIWERKSEQVGEVSGVLGEEREEWVWNLRENLCE